MDRYRHWFGDKYGLRWIGLMFLLCLQSTALNAAVYPTWNIEEAGLELVSKIDTEPPAGEWDDLIELEGGKRIVFNSSGGYILSVVRNEFEGNDVCDLELAAHDRRSFSIQGCRVQYTLPLKQVVAEWDTQVPPFGTFFRRNPNLQFDFRTAPNLGIPLSILVDHYGNTSLAAGCIDQSHLLKFSGKREGYDYQLEIARSMDIDPWSGEEYSESFFLSTRKAFWFDVAKQYASLVEQKQGKTRLPLPPRSDKPVIGTWQVFGEQLEQQKVWDFAVKASELGFGTILIGAGWSTPGGWANPNNKWGSYVAESSEFPDFKGFVERVHNQLDMNVLVWVSPFWIGEQSEEFDGLSDARCMWPGGNYDRHLCPRVPKVRKYLKQKFTHLFRTYPIDGIYIDFLDTVPSVCIAPHQHDPQSFGEGYRLAMQAIVEGVRSVKPDAWIETRIPFANLFDKPFFNVYETTDSPHYDVTRLLGIFSRIYTDGMVLRPNADRWDKLQKDVHHDDVGRYCSSMTMTGVPAFSLPILDMREGWMENLEGWLGFWQEHTTALLRGTFRPAGVCFHYPDSVIEDGGKAFIYLATDQTRHLTLSEEATELHILNGSDNIEVFLQVHGLRNGDYLGRFFNQKVNYEREESFKVQNQTFILKQSRIDPGGGLSVSIK